MFSKSSILAAVTLALGATSVFGAALPARRGVEPDMRNIVRRTSSGYVSFAYFVNWGIYARNFQPADIDVSTVTHILYSFMDVNPSTGNIVLSDSYADLEKHYPDDSWDGTGANAFGCVKQLYGLKLKNRHLKVVFSVGGWTYAQAGHFDFALDAGKRATFVADAVKMIEDFGMDGIDIDWEFPDNQEQMDAFTALMTELRAGLDKLASDKKDEQPYLLSAAVSAGPSHYKWLDVAKANAPLDFWNLMAYDYAGSWSNFTADNANLYYGETTGFNTDQAVQWFLKAGATASKITMGLPLYGRSFVGTDGIYTPFTGIGTADQEHGSYEAGVYDYKHLPLDGHEVTENTTSVAAYSYSATDKQLISFDTPAIIKTKVEYIQKQKLGGSMWWELSGDKAGADSLVAIASTALGGLDTTPNHVNFPNSQYDNIKNNLGETPADAGSGGGEAPSSSAPADPSTTAPADPSTSAPVDPPATTPADPTTSAPADPTSTPVTPPPTPSSCPAKRRK